MTDEPGRMANEDPTAAEQAADAPVLDERNGEPIASAHAAAPITGAPSLPGPSLPTAIAWMIGFLVGQNLFVAALALAFALPMILKGEGQQEIIDQVTAWGAFMATGGSLVMAVLIAGLMFGRQAFRKLGLRRPDVAQLVIVALLVAPLMMVANAVAGLVDYLVPVKFDPQGEAVKQIALGGWLSIVFAGCLFPAIGEEVFFRGFLGRGLVARWGPIAGVIITSIGFGLFHIMPAQIAGTFVLGLGFHAVYLMTRSLPASMAMHFLTNLLGLSMFFLAHEANQPLDETIKLTDLRWIVTLWSAAATVLILGLLLYRLRSRWEFTTESPWQEPYVSGETPLAPARATRDSIAEHRWLAAAAALAWIAFAAVFVGVAASQS